MADKNTNFENEDTSDYHGKRPGEGSNPDEYNFTPQVLDKTIIALPLLKEMQEEDKLRGTLIDQNKSKRSKGGSTVNVPKRKVYDVIIDLNLGFEDGRKGAQERVVEMVKSIMDSPHIYQGKINEIKTKYSNQYVFASLTGDMIRQLVREDHPEASKQKQRAVHRIWPDFEVKAFTSRSVSTVKADAARHSFSALGDGIVWAVIDSGIDKDHPHFKLHKNIHESYHRDFTAFDNDGENPFNDEFGHGTHVAGIIAGEMKAGEVAEELMDKTAITPKQKLIRAITRHRNDKNEIVYEETKLENISGMAPKCKLVSLKALDQAGRGKASNLIVAIEYIQELNGYGRDIKIHGVNMSLGYDFDPEWFACGHSPLCVEVDRLVKTGVVVVAAAGNTGYGYAKSAFRNVVATGLPLSINDPGNAALAITVGSTHRDMPHTYGVSYFSSKGPTGDGRLKPDLVAPGEKIISCAAGIKKTETNKHLPNTDSCDYVEDSGTSMAAPHVSGVIASFLSVRREYIGKPEVVKEIFMNTATDLKRDRYFQGAGLIDLMRAIQSV
ncbi:S8 family peptidase [Adhaeribacter soli]|uniref:S8 family peptidase n=1 Tax=Adhaeribacter soli TaxID=2607655 RepID=A0A5N1IZS0_9BACT|nr:S8 family peptidase [Adhaeribacter soli]KAA9338966.1 S8 family peptidase [Adhaeribacter soli]